MHVDGSDGHGEVDGISAQLRRARQREFETRLDELEGQGFQIVRRDDKRLEATVLLRSRVESCADTWRQVWVDPDGTVQGIAIMSPEPDQLDAH
jgi:hypothetical protein